MSFEWRAGASRKSSLARSKSRNRLRSERLEDRLVLSAVLWDPLSLTPIAGISASESTGQKPQSKVWQHDDTWFSVMPDKSGTWLWRLDASAWTPVLKLSSNSNTAADVKTVGNLAHVLLYDGTSSQFATLESQADNTYKFWSLQPQLVNVQLSSGVETATIDVDSTGRLWIASDASNTVEVRYSDGLYTSFSNPIVVASGIGSDDISSIIAMPDGKVGVFWSNQNTKRFGFRTHIDGTDPTLWTADEVPASQSAKNVGNGFADDHMHLAVAANGTLYVAAKTSYDSSSHEQIVLLVRRPNGAWDDVYTVDTSGTRPVVVISETHNELAVIYTDKTGGGNIVLRGTELDTIQFGAKRTLISGNLDDSTTSKANVGDQILVLATKSGSAVGSLIQLPPSGPPTTPQNSAPQVNAGPDQAITLPSAAVLNGSASDDGRPSPANLSVLWTKVSGPGNVTFANPSAASTTATFSQAGTYVLQLTASDGSLQSSDQVTIQVQSAPSTPPPSPGPVDPPSSQQGLVGHWTLEGSGNDQSGLGNNGALAGTTSVVAGKNGNALRVAGTGRVVVPDSNSLDLTTAITMSAWIRPEKLATQYVIGKKGKSNINGYELSLSSDGKVFVRFNEASSSNTYRIDSKSKYPSNGQTWMHVAATYDGTTIKLYINGVLETSKAAKFAIGTNTLALGIGAEQDGYRGLTGALDEVRIYSRALNDQEIGALMNNSPPPAPQNSAPTVNAGADLTITLPNQATLNGSASDDGLPSPANLSTFWSKISGPGNVTFGNVNAASTTASFSQAGTYVLQLMANDGQFQSSDQVMIQVQPQAPLPPQNSAPTVNAGADLTITLPNTATLNGSASDDGLPSPANLATFWTKISGPGNVTFGNASAASTTASFSQAGTYVLQLTANDGQFQSSDQVTIQVQPQAPLPPQNNAPTVNAGPDVSVTLPNTATLNGSASDDGLPSPANLSTFWTKISGPGNVTFGNINAATTTASFSQAGTYVLQLTANDGQFQSSDQVTIQMQPAAPPPPTPTEQGLVGYWSLNGDGADQSGLGNHGTLTGTTSLVAGKFGDALRVAGTGRVVVPDSNSLDLTTAITMSAWIRPEKLATQYVIGKKGKSNINGYELSLSSDGKVFVRFNEASSSNTYRIDSKSKYPTNGQTWMHVAATYDGTTIKLFINGVLETSKAAKFAIGTNTLALGIGAEQDGYRGLTGALDEVRIYSRALNDQEIGALVNNSPPAAPQVQPEVQPPQNTAPSVNAGPDQTITLPGAATLNGSASDDGLPGPGNLSLQWSKISGPGNVTFGNAGVASTTASFSQAGTYVLQLLANDGSLQSNDEVTIQVTPAPAPQPPAPPANPQLTEGLVGWWSLDGNGVDQSGLGNHGSLAGSVASVVGKDGGALRFASGGRLVVPDNPSLDPQTSITIAAWIRPEATATQYLVDKKGKSNIDGYELSLSSDGKVFVRFNEASAGNTYRIDSASKYPKDGQTWMHVVATYDGSTIKLYINGRLEASKAASFRIAANDIPLGIGAEQDGYRGLTGALDDVRIYSRALGDAEVTALFSR